LSPIYKESKKTMRIKKKARILMINREKLQTLHHAYNLINIRPIEYNTAIHGHANLGSSENDLMSM